MKGPAGAFPVPVLFVILTVLGAAAPVAGCGPRGPGLKAPTGMPTEPVPIWSAVTPESSVVIHAVPEPFLDVPLARLGLDLLMQSFTDISYLAYEDMVRELGFDPLFDLRELFVTNLASHLDENFVILLRYDEERDYVEPTVKLFSGMLKEKKAESIRRLEIKGRKAAEFNGGEYTVVQVDPVTVAVLRAPAEDAEGWIEQMSEPNDNRKRISGLLGRLAKNPALAGRKPALTLFWEHAAVASLFSSKKGVSEALDMTRMALQLAVDGDIFLAGQADYADEAAARKQAEEMKTMCTKPKGALAFFAEMMRDMCESLKIEQKGTRVSGSLTLPESLLETVYVTLKLMLDVGKSGGGEGSGIF
jgi:hypothetical protein